MTDESDDRNTKVVVILDINIQHLHMGEGSLNQPESFLRGDKHILHQTVKDTIFLRSATRG